MKMKMSRADRFLSQFVLCGVLAAIVIPLVFPAWCQAQDAAHAATLIFGR